MEMLKKVNDICPSCMKKHAVQIIRVHEHLTFKTVPVEFDAEYCYCENTGDTFANGNQLTKNDIVMKNAYREKMGLLTSDQIIGIRQKFGMSQSGLSRVLGWPDDAVKRYESHEVQDIEDDKILRKIDADFKWVQHVKPTGYFDTPDPYKDPPECHINIRKLSSYITETGKDLSELTKDEIMMFYTT